MSFSLSGKRKALSAAVNIRYGRRSRYGLTASRNVTLNPTGTQKALEEAAKRERMACKSPYLTWIFAVNGF